MPPRGGRTRGSTHSRSAPSRTSRRRGSRTPHRLVALFVLLSLAFGGMMARFVVLQVFEFDEYRALAAEFRQREFIFPAHRGTILDRAGDPLAQSVELQTVFAEPTDVVDVATTAKKLARVLDVGPKELASGLRGTFPGDRFEILARQVDPKTAAKVERLELPGVHLQTEPRRIYPNGRLASHLLGFVNADGDALGGVELQYDDILKGKPGRMLLEQDPTGRSLPQADFEFERATPGRSLYLTIDKDLQYFTEHALKEAVDRYGAEAGTAIVLDPRTGEILALANLPDYDPNTFNRFDDDERRNRAVTDNYEPGSAFKVVTAAAALETGAVNRARSFQIPDTIQVADRVIHDSHSHQVEKMNVADIIRQSSNVGAVRLGLELGAKRLDEWIRRFGFGKKTGLDFPGEASGILLDVGQWSGSTIGTVPLGQGIAVTPLQMAAAFGVIANKGVWVEPKLVHATLSPRGEVATSPPASRRRVLSKRTANQMLEILTEVVVDGTGTEAQIAGYAVAGKTGTAQKPLPTGGYGNSHVASFIGAVPASRPELVIVVTLDEPTPIWGGLTAAPTFREIAEFAVRHLGVPPTGNAEKAARRLEEEGARDPVVHD